MKAHMGPEPSYIIDGENGLLFDENSIESLKNTIKNIINNPFFLKKLQKNTFSTYVALTQPSLGERLLSIINDVLGSTK
jgi:glycosyltransferase involved in cell wall biosynthesis